MWKEVFRIELPGLPPSINTLYATFRGRRIKSRAGKVWDAMSIPIIRRASIEMRGRSFFKDRERMPLKVEVLFYRPTWYCKAKTRQNEFKLWDVDNHGKAPLDSLKEGLGLDDKAVFDFNLRKITDVEGSERTLINLCFWEKDE